MEDSSQTENTVESRDRRGCRYSVYCRVVQVYTGIFLGYLGYFPILGLLTSFNADLGYVTAGLLWPLSSLAQIVAPVTISMFGVKRCLIIHFCVYAVYYATYFYPSWYTIPLSATAVGLSAGLFFWTAALSYLTEAAQELSQQQKKYPKTHYVSMFHGGLYGVFHFAGFAGNALAAAFFLSDQLILDSTVLNSSNLTNSSVNEVCTRNTLYTAVSSWAYYGFFSISTASAIVGVVTLCCLPNKDPKRTVCNASVCKATLCSIKPLLVNTLKGFIVPKYSLMLTLSFYYGLDKGFFFATFTKHFVSECLGVGLVGPVVMVWSVSSSLASFVNGRTSTYTSRTAVAIVSFCVQIGLMVFMFVWEREASYLMVFTVSILWGYVDGNWQTLPSTYVGVVADEESRTVAFSVLKVTYSIGGLLNFFLASVMPVHVNLILLAVVLLIAILPYIIGEVIYAKDRARMFPCCRDSVPEEKDRKTQSPNPNVGGITNCSTYFETPL